MDVDKYIENADKEVKKAQKALSGGFFDKIFGSKEERIEKA